VSSVLLGVVTIGAGLFTVLLGLVHVAIPSILRYSEAIGVEAGRPGLGRIALPHVAYQLHRSDLIGIAWVMSNAASYVLVTIGLVDLAWVSGWRGVPIAIGAGWIAGWWAIRAGGQLLVGRRIGDLVIAMWFGALAVVHVAIAAVAH
jgi:hypothetical protein